jgi:hypothetical protein
MNTRPFHPTHPYAADPAALHAQQRLAARLAGALSETSARVPHDIGERLRVSREQAVARSRLARQAERSGAGAPGVLGQADGSAVLGAPVPWWQRAISVLPLAVLVAGLVLANRWVMHEQVLDSAEIDAVLLADDLPPEAYTDPGFAEYLRSAPPP